MAKHKTETVKTEHGTLYKNALILRLEAGEAKDNDGNTYHLFTHPRGCPIVENQKTHKMFLVPWAKIITWAKEAGIDTA